MHGNGTFQTDPATQRVIGDLRRRLDEVGAVADRVAAREAEISLLRRRLDAVLAARRSEVAALQSRITELEARFSAPARSGDHPDTVRLIEERDAAQAAAAELREALAAMRAGEGRDIVVTIETTRTDVPDPQSGEYRAWSGILERRVNERVAGDHNRLADRLARQQAALEEKDQRIRELVALLGGDPSTRIAELEEEVSRLRGAAEPPPPDPTDLQQIRGIGPAIEGTLRSLGITSIDHIAELDDAALDRIDEALGAFRGRARRDGWVQQARRIAQRPV